jgi:hypothetical protein
MQKLFSHEGEISYNIKEWVCDTVEDLVNLPSGSMAMGSTAFIISTSELYMLNSEGEWVKI